MALPVQCFQQPKIRKSPGPSLRYGQMTAKRYAMLFLKTVSRFDVLCRIRAMAKYAMGEVG